ncbi:MAG: hypothetical protein HN391_13635 [Anaerolineae bacterium]|nr:hypothetical protein [Anaerolineae bacterium]
MDTIALIAKNLAWIAIVLGVLVTIGEYTQTKYYLEFQVQSMNLRGAYDAASLLKEKPIFSLSLVVDMFNIFLKSVIYAVVLKGISLALYMLIEIDLNYSLLSEEEGE